MGRPTIHKVWTRHQTFGEGAGTLREIQEPLVQIRTAASPVKFDPATSTRAFRVAVTDYLSNVLWPLLREHVEQYAPGIRILAVPYTSQETGTQLRNNDIDICMGGLQPMGGDIRLQPIFVENWICAMRSKHPLANAALTEEDFLNADHLLVSLSGSPVGFADIVLERHGKRRRVAMTLNNFSGVPSLLLASNLISVLPPASYARMRSGSKSIHAMCPSSFLPSSVRWPGTPGMIAIPRIGG